MLFKKRIQIFNWCEHFGHWTRTNQQGEIFTGTLLNIFSNFIPNKTIPVRPRQAPWITHSIKNHILKKIEDTKHSLEMVDQMIN